MQKFTTLILIVSSVLIASSFALAYYAYFTAGSAFNFYETLSSLMFWLPVVALAIWFPLRSTMALFARYIRTVRGKLIFVSYASVHLVLYGLLLELILEYAYKLPGVAAQPTVYFSSNLLYSTSLSAIVTSFGFYPNISVLVPPSFDFVWSFYCISFALIMSVLVVTNIMQVVDLGNLYATTQKTRAFVLLPMTGVIVGATCCLSFPVLISLATLSVPIFSNSIGALLIAYFIFPIAAAIALKYNVDSTNRMATDIQRLKRSLSSAIKGLS